MIGQNDEWIICKVNNFMNNQPYGILNKRQREFFDYCDLEEMMFGC